MTPNSELDRLFPAIPKPDPLGVMCGGCGERNPGRRCIGCLHDFGPVDADETNHGPCAQGIAAMSKHTPGPWGIERTYDTNWIGFMRPHDPKKVQLIVCTTSRESLTDEALARNDANARLIAAAPEMFEALDTIGGLSRALRQGGPDPMDLQGLSDALEEAVNLANSLVAQIEGRT